MHAGLNIVNPPAGSKRAGRKVQRTGLGPSRTHLYSSVT